MDLCRVLFRCWCFLILFDSSASLRNQNNLRKRNPDNRPTILLQDNIQNKSNVYNNRNLQSRKQFEIHRNNKSTSIRDVHRQNINKNYYKSDRKNPTWTMLDALLSGFPEIEEVHLNINDNIQHPSSDLFIDLPKSTDLDARPDLNLLFQKPTEKSNWELITNAPKSPQLFGQIHRRPQTQHNLDVSFKNSNLDADNHHSFSSPFVPTTSKPDNQVSIKPFWGRPISELSPKHFIFQKGSNNNNHQTTSAITTSTSSPKTSTSTLISSTSVEDTNEDEEEDDYSDDNEQQRQSQISGDEEDKSLKNRISNEYSIEKHKKILIKTPLKTYHSVPVIQPMQRVDFGPIFLALIPIALALGAAASLALTSAVQPNQAIAMAQQQQQQQSENSNSNNNQNSNSALLESLAIVNSLNKGGSSGHQYPPILILDNNGTVAAFSEGKRRRKKK